MTFLKKSLLKCFYLFTAHSGSIDEFQVIFRTDKLEDGQYVTKYDIKHMSTVHTVLYMKGGFCSGPEQSPSLCCLKSLDGNNSCPWSNKKKDEKLKTKAEKKEQTQPSFALCEGNRVMLNSHSSHACSFMLLKQIHFVGHISLGQQLSAREHCFHSDSFHLLQMLPLWDK